MGRKAWAAGLVALAWAGCGDSEQDGLALLNNPGKGNCTAWHPSQRQEHSPHALFTDFTFDAVGVPRNWNIPAILVDPRSPTSGAPLIKPCTPPAFAGGQTPTLSASEVDDVVAFLCPLTDGHDPNNPAAYHVPAQCLPGAP